MAKKWGEDGWSLGVQNCRVPRELDMVKERNSIFVLTKHFEYVLMNMRGRRGNLWCWETGEEEKDGYRVLMAEEEEFFLPHHLWQNEVVRSKHPRAVC